MKRISTFSRVVTTIVAGIALAAAALPGAAHAGSDDHMKCTRVEDAAVVATSAVDLDTVVFGAQTGCVVSGAARELCVPAASDVLAPAADGKAVRGEALLDERLCYELSCPTPAATAFVASDRFGTRTITLKKAKRFCTPAAPASDAITR